MAERFSSGLWFKAGLVVLLLLTGVTADQFEVVVGERSPIPKDGAKKVRLDAVIRVHFSKPLATASLQNSTMYLLDSKGKPVPAFLQSDLTGGVATLTPTLLLRPNHNYTLKITASLRSEEGDSLKPFVARFSTSNARVSVDQKFVFKRSKVDSRDHNSCITIGPDGYLYVANTFGHVKRYRLDAMTGMVVGSDTAYHAPDDQIVDIEFDPDASADNLIAWISYARYGEQFSGAIARVVFQPFGSDGKARKKDAIIGLPHDKLLHHQPNGLAFGPKGKLYQAVGGLTTLGGSPNWGMKETPMSAAVLVADVRNKNFNGGKWPCNVQTSKPVNYDPYAATAPVKIFATGFRNAYALCWHSSGHLFTATNQNSIPDGPKMPADPKRNVPAINAMPREMLYRVKVGKYYGHPNPSRQEFVLNGGNPTASLDPFEVEDYPVGIQPHAAFDPSLIYDLRAGGGNSANGIAEYTSVGPLKGRLLIAYFSGSKTIQSFALNDKGIIMNERALIDVKGNPIRFMGALDVAVHRRSGRIYVADFGQWKRLNFGEGGAIWMLEPRKITN